MKCGVCNRAYRSGTLAYVNVGGQLDRRRVCSKCAAAAVLLVQGKGATRCACGNTATMCAGCANTNGKKENAKVVKGAIEKIENVALAYAKRYGDKGIAPDDAMRIEGLTQAAEILKRGDW